MTTAKTALVTGGTDGIGRAVVERLAADGWRVLLTARSSEKAAATLAAVRASHPGAAVEALNVDLSSMAGIAGLCAGLRSGEAPLARLDLLLLNANAITQRHTLTSEGFEANLAIGHLGRAALFWGVLPILAATPGAQVLSVVGLNLSPYEPTDARWEAPGGGVRSMEALGRWQWAQQAFLRAYEAQGKVFVNTFMPGLVRTKILADEPQPMRLFVQIANRLVGIAPAQSAAEVVAVVDDVARTGRTGAYYARTRHKGRRDLKADAAACEAVYRATATHLRRADLGLGAWVPTP